MKIKTSDLEGVALDWAVAQIDPMCSCLTWEAVPGGRVGFIMISGEKTPCAFLSHGSCLSERMRFKRDGIQSYSPSTDWSQIGPLIEQYKVDLSVCLLGNWKADSTTVFSSSPAVYAPTPLIAACRMIVAVKLGDEVDIPEELTCSV